MNRAIIILKDSLEWNMCQINNAKQSISDGCRGQKLSDCKKIIRESELHNEDIEKSLRLLKSVNTAFDLGNFSNQRELLIAYELKVRNCTDKQAEIMVDSYLSSSSIN